MFRDLRQLAVFSFPACQWWLLASAAGLLMADAQVTFSQMPDLSGGTLSSYLRRVSTDGAVRVGGHYDGNQRAVKWTDGGGVVALANLNATYPHGNAFGVSADGSVTVGHGRNASAQVVPVYWDAGGITEMPRGSMVSGWAMDASADGSVIVGSGWYGSHRHAFRWTAAGGMVDLGDLGDGSYYSHATAVSDDGNVITGYSSGYVDNIYRYRGYRWTAADGMVDLGAFPGADNMVIPLQVSGDGSTIVGYARTSSGNQPFRWTGATGVAALEIPDGNAYDGIAFCASEDGKVIGGRLFDGNLFKAVVWLPDSGLQDVATLLSDGGVDLTGWRLNVVMDMSADGSVLFGNGVNPSGRYTGWMATLATPPDPVLVSVPGTLSVAEDAGTLNVTVSLDATHSENVSVDYSTASITATAADDFVAVSGTVTIPAGQTSTTIPVGIFNDSTFESDETFSLTISNPVNGEIVAAATLVTIEEDDAPPPDPSSVIFPGNFDASFAENGRTLSGLALESSDAIRDMAIDRQGRAVLLGDSWRGESYKPVVIRLLPDGRVDSAFGEGGITEPWRGSTYKDDTGFAVTMQADGKILVCGRISPASGNSKLVVARLHADGTLDTGFGSDGSFTYPGGSTSSSFATDIIELEDGSIRVLGSHTQGGVTDALMIALDQGGSPSAGFSGDGIHLLFDGDAQKVSGNTFELDAEGRFVIGGKLSDDFGVARVNRDGSTDTGFGSSGFVRMSFSAETDEVVDLDLDAAGRIVGVGKWDSISGSQRKYRFGLFRLTADGSPDTSFHYDGRAHPLLGTSNEEIPTTVEVLDSGRILSCGHTVNGFGIIRLHNNGDQDTSFGDSGVALIGPTTAIARSLHVDVDGSLLIAGHRASNPHDPVIARLTANGAPDTSWGTDGVVQWDLGRALHYAEWLGMHRDTQGRIYTAGYVNPNYREGMAGRYDADGNLDYSYGNGGFDRYKKISTHVRAWDVTTDGVGNAYVTGTEGSYLFIRKLDSSGQLDTDFVGDGIHTFRPVTGSYQEVFIDRDAEGNLIVATSAYVSGTLQVILTKITPEGAYETGFGTSGSTVSSFPNHHFVRGFHQLPDGRLLVCGHVHDGTEYKPFAARFLADGTPDSGFGTAGYAEFTGFAGPYTTEGLAVDGDGRVIITGSVDSRALSAYPEAFLVRMTADGTLDATFGDGGLVTTHLNLGSLFGVAGVHVLTDGRILVGGHGWPGGTDGDLFLLRFHPDGGLDTSFGIEGKALMDVEQGLNYSGYGDKLNVMLAIDDDRVLGAGGADGDDGYSRPLLGRFLVKDLSYEDHMTLSGLGGADASPGADANHDGIPNILSVAFGIDPLTGAGRGTRYPKAALSQEGAAGELQFSVPVSPPANLTCVVYGSENLSTWNEIARRTGPGEWSGTATVTIIDTVDGQYQLSVDCPQEATCGFYRVEVQLDE